MVIAARLADHECPSRAEKGVVKKMTFQQLIYKVLVANAVKGQARATAQLFNLMHEFGMLKGLGQATQAMVVRFVSAKTEK